MKNKVDKSKNKNKKSLWRALYYNGVMLKLILKYTPGLFIYTFLFMIITGLRAVMNNVYAVKYLVDCIQSKRSPMQIMGFVALFIGINLVDSITGTYYENVYSPKKQIVLSRKMQGDLFQKASEIDLAAYDNPKFYNDFIWATNNADAQAMNVLKNFGEFVRTITRIGGVGAIILSSDIVGLVIVAASLVISFLSELKANKLDFELSLQQKPIQRERDYTSHVLYVPDYAKEIRLTHIGHQLVHKFSKVNRNLIATIKKYGKKTIFWAILGEGVAVVLLMDLGYTMYLCYMTLVKAAFTYGTFVALYNGVFHLRYCLNGMGRIIARFRKDSLYIEHLMEFMNYESKLKELPQPEPVPKEQAVMELRNVFFRYDGTDKDVLKNVNLTIHPGEKIAIVGYNGAGKTTLTKLLMRLYDVTEGEIRLDGKNVKEFGIEEYRKYFGAVFQDYQLFAGTVAENVKMGIVEEEDRENIRDALEKAGFSEKLASLERQEDTVLTREFDKKGTNLSGGEAQKVAIARVFAKNCKMVILDEPSSALDPISEYNINHSMLEAAKDKTVVFVSHRLSTTRIADRIIMFEDGEIIEEGSHSQLMELNGKYAEMFLLQAEKYREGAM